MTEAPPFEVGAVQRTMIEPFAPVTWTLSGALGVVDGTTGPEGADAGDEPPAKLATTVKVYAVPFTRPVTVQVSVEPFGVVQVLPEGEEVAV